MIFVDKVARLLGQYTAILDFDTSSVCTYLQGQHSSAIPNAPDIRKSLLIILSQNEKATEAPYCSAAQKLAKALENCITEYKVFPATVSHEISRGKRWAYRLDESLAFCLRQNFLGRAPRLSSDLSNNELFIYATSLLLRRSYHQYLAKTAQSSPTTTLFQQTLDQTL